jgi:hypothetical protein
VQGGGVGIPGGGEPYQILMKKSLNDYDTKWVFPEALINTCKQDEIEYAVGSLISNMKEVIQTIRELEYRQELITDIIVPKSSATKYPGDRGILSYRTRERFRNGTPFKINISKPRRKNSDKSVFTSSTVDTRRTPVQEVAWSDVDSDEIQTTVETEDSYIDITIVFDGGNSTSTFMAGPVFDLGNSGVNDLALGMNTISIIFDAGNSDSTNSSIVDTLTTSSYVTNINYKESTMVSIIFDGGTSVSNYVFGPSFDLGNSTNNLLTDCQGSVSSSSSSSSESECPENVFVFDGGDCNTRFTNHRYQE